MIGRPMKHLVIDARGALPQVDGVGTYLRAITPTLCAAGEASGRFRTTLIVHPELVASWRAAAPAAAVVASAIRPMRPAQNWQLPALLRPLAPDLLFYPGHDPPMLSRIPFVFTIHDVTLFQWRPYFESFDRGKLAYMKLVTPWGLRRARAVFAVSEYTKQAIGEMFGARWLPKVHVTPNGMTPPSEPRAGDAAPGRRLLYVGTDRPHKNLPRVIEAYALALRERADLPPLDIVGGMRTPQLLRAMVRERGLDDRVRLRGHVTVDELEASYREALALLFPSVAEGFGLPILEAMARGVPVLTSNTTGCAEVAGDAALLVDPASARAIANGILRLVAEPELRADLARRGPVRAASFTWERTAQLTLDTLERALGYGQGAQ